MQGLELLDLTGPYTIANFAKLFQEGPVGFSMDVKVRVSGMKDSLHSSEWPPLGLDTDFTLAFSGQGMDLALDFVLQLSDRLRSLEVVDFFNTGCAIRIIKDMLPTLLELKIDEVCALYASDCPHFGTFWTHFWRTLAQVGLDVTCRKCTPKLLEWEARTKSGPNLEEFTRRVNAFIENYAELFEVEHDVEGSLMHTAEDKRESDESMRPIWRWFLKEKQGITHNQWGDEVLEVADQDACVGMVHRTSSLEDLSVTRCAKDLIIAHSTYGSQFTFDNVDDASLIPARCDGLGQQCEYLCDVGYHVDGEPVFERIGTVECQMNGEYTEFSECVEITDTVFAWGDGMQDYWGGELMLALGIALSLLIVCCCARKKKVKRRRSLEARDMTGQDEEEHRLQRVPTKGDGSGTGQGHRSLMRNANLPRWVRIYVPVVLAINVGFFVMGHLITMASVDIVIKLFGRDVRIDGIVTLSISSTLEKLLSANPIPWPLVFLVGGMSGIWPYTKLTLIFSCWMLPPSRLRPKKRGQWLMTLDALGKWSLVDVYIIMFFMLAFRVNVTSPDIGVLPPQLWHMDLKLTAIWGIFSFTIAVISSLIVNNLAIHYHRNALAKEHTGNLLKERREYERLAAPHKARDEDLIRADSLAGKHKLSTSASKKAKEAKDGYAALSNDESAEGPGRTGSEPDMPAPSPLVDEEAYQEGDENVSWYNTGTLDVHGIRSSLVYNREALCDHVFSLKQYEVWFPIGGQLMVTLLLLGSISLTILGAFWFDSFAVETYGIGAAAQNFGAPGSSVKIYTIQSSFQALMAQADPDETQEVRYGIYFLGYCYMAFAIYIPLVQQVGLLLLWTTPLTLRMQKFVFFSIEILHGWAAMPVFLLALIVGVIEVGMLSGSMIPKGIAPKDLMDTLMEWTIISKEDSQAGLMQIEMVPHTGLFLLITACILEYIGATIVVRCGEVCIDEREWRISGRPPNEEQEMGCGKPIMDKLMEGTSCCFCIPLSPGLRFMPRFFVKRHNLSKLLLKGINDLPPGDQDELFKMTASLNPMEGVDRAGEEETHDLRRSMIHKQGTVSETPRYVLPRVSEEDEPAHESEELTEWHESMARATVNMWTSATGEGKAAAAAGAALTPAKLPPGWTTTMWQGELYYWNSITGQTSDTPPGLGEPTMSASKKVMDADFSDLSPTDKWKRSAVESISALDAALRQRVERRDETDLDESMPYEGEEPDDGEWSRADEETGLVRARFFAKPFLCLRFWALNAYCWVRTQINSAKRSVSSLRATLSRQGSEHSKLEESEEFEPEPEPEIEEKTRMLPAQGSPAARSPAQRLSPAVAGSPATPNQTRRVRTIGSV